ncbi:hypothetical protein ABPG72_004143 [Tetrahymena utriculariae]
MFFLQKFNFKLQLFQIYSVVFIIVFSQSNNQKECVLDLFIRKNRNRQIKQQMKINIQSSKFQSINQSEKQSYLQINLVYFIQEIKQQAKIDFYINKCNPKINNLNTVKFIPNKLKKEEYNLLYSVIILIKLRKAYFV